MKILFEVYGCEVYGCGGEVCGGGGECLGVGVSVWVWG